MAALKNLYPSTSTVAIALTLASLASDSSMVSGRASTAISNTADLDLDHLLCGTIRAGTSPVAGSTIEVWLYSVASVASGTPTYVDGITGTDADKTITSANVKFSAMRLAASITVDNVTGRDYAIAPVSVASLFGALPPFWGVFVAHGTGVALNATQVALQYIRSQNQSTV